MLQELGLQSQIRAQDQCIQVSVTTCQSLCHKFPTSSSQNPQATKDHVEKRQRGICLDAVMLSSELPVRETGAGNADGQLPLLNLLRTETWSNFYRKGWHCQCWDSNLNSFWSGRAGQKELVFNLGHRCVCICLLLTFSYSPVIRRLSLQCVEIIPHTVLPSTCLLLNWNLGTTELGWDVSVQK